MVGDGPSLTVVYGLLSALTWGSADFGGGMAARRGPVFGVVLVSQAVGMAIAFGLALGRGESFPRLDDLGWAIAAGVAGSAGVAGLYHGLATARIAVVAPITGVLAATLPVVAGWFLQGTPLPGQVVGIALALAAVVLVSTSAGPAEARPAGVRFGLLAGVGFGLFNVFASRFAAGSVFGPLVVVRGVEAIVICAVVLATGSAWRLRGAAVPIAVAVGLGDMAGNGFFILAAQAGRLDLAGVLSSLYPVTTIVLASVILRDRVTRRHAAGIGAAILAIVLIAGG
ncbi:MAG: DMT family transporter [Chloroflexi bacterium]|nr:DMT family transporter [Chloroflexota bacterium]